MNLYVYILCVYVCIYICTYLYVFIFYRVVTKYAMN